MALEKNDHHVDVFMGTTYELCDIRTIGDLRRALQSILDDLPEDDALVVSEVWLERTKFRYFLQEGVFQ